MNFARIFLVLNGFFLGGYGVYCIFNPWILSEFADLGMKTSTAVTEVRAMYGGLEFGLGLLFLVSGIRSDRTNTGLLVTLFAFGGLAIARSFGLAVDGFDMGYNFLAVIYEASSAILALVFLKMTVDKA